MQIASVLVMEGTAIDGELQMAAAAAEEALFVPAPILMSNAAVITAGGSSMLTLNPVMDGPSPTRGSSKVAPSQVFEILI